MNRHARSIPARPALVAALDDVELDPAVPHALWQRALTGPAAEFLARPGKELRAAIVHAGWTLGGGSPAGGSERIALVVELLHAGSLIVDDVQDNSDERRGGPALHKLVGVPLAINTGSWMYFWALAQLAELGLPPVAQRVAVETLMRCHQGQALDLTARVSDLDIHDVPGVVETTTRLKTGALCRLAAELGAIAAGASVERRTAIAAFGEAMGIGLQMLDDLGSLSPARRAKGREDLLGDRPTWPWAWLAAHRPFAWTRLVDHSRSDALLDMLAAEVGEIGRSETHAWLEAAHATLVSALGKSAATDELAAQLARMEKSYG